MILLGLFALLLISTVFVVTAAAVVCEAVMTWLAGHKTDRRQIDGIEGFQRQKT